LNSSDALRSIPPPSQGSIQFNQDVNELKALQLNRTVKGNESIYYWNNGSVVRWNEIARSLVVKNSTSAPMASRVYALLSVAQYDALVSAWNNKYTYNRSSPHDIDPSIQPAVQTTSDPAYPSDHALSLEHPQQCSRTSIPMKPRGSPNKQLQTRGQGFKLG
jgi:hypothetical protein